MELGDGDLSLLSLDVQGVRTTGSYGLFGNDQPLVAVETMVRGGEIRLVAYMPLRIVDELLDPAQSLVWD
jgi:hypothetical protein